MKATLPLFAVKPLLIIYVCIKAPFAELSDSLSVLADVFRHHRVGGNPAVATENLHG